MFLKKIKMNLKFDWKFVIGSFIAIAGICIPAYFWFYDKSDKILNIEIISSASLYPEKSGVLDGLDLFYKNEKIINPYLNILRLKNSGSKTISSTDFDTPLKITFGDGVSILGASVSSAYPEDLNPKLKLGKYYVLVEPLLLNVNESFTIKVVSAGGVPNFGKSARISGGVSNIHWPAEQEISKLDLSLKFLLVALFIAIYVVSLMYALINYLAFRRDYIWNIFVGLVALFPMRMVLSDIYQYYDLSILQLILILLTVVIICAPLIYKKFKKLIQLLTDLHSFSASIFL